MILGINNELENHIVLVLSKKGRLSSKDILSLLIKDDVNATIQGVNRAVRKLIREGVLMKEGQQISLRIPWILELIRFAEETHNTYVHPEYIQKFLPTKQGDKRVWRFTSLHDLGDFWGQVLVALTAHSEDKVLLNWSPHPWFQLAQPEREAQYLRSIYEKLDRVYSIIGGRTFLDKHASQSWEFNNFEFYFAGENNWPEKDRGVYFNITDSLIVTVTLDPETTQRIDELYERVKSQDGLAEENLLQLFTQPIKAKLAIEKNSKKVTQYTKWFTEVFGVLANKQLINQFSDIKYFPAQPGIVMMGISMAHINRRQSPKKCYEDIDLLAEKITKSEVGLNVIYCDGLYGNSQQPASELKAKYQKLMAEHKVSYVKRMQRIKKYIPRAVSFYTWSQFVLECPEYNLYMTELKNIYSHDAKFRKYVKEDIARAGKLYCENNIQFILDDILMSHLATKGEVRLQNDFVGDREVWILDVYPGKPHKSHIYLSQLNPFKLDNPKNIYQDSWYDLEEKKLYDFKRVDLDTIEL